MDRTEEVRRIMVAAINSEPKDRAGIEKRCGKVWDTVQLSEDFDVLGFAAPFVIVRRKTDGVKGTLMFQHLPRFYFSFAEDV